METFGNRLKSERIRLGMTQEAFGAACDRGKIMQMNYEKDNGTPDLSYLFKAKELGVDLNFLLLGQHSVEALAEDEAHLLTAYRAQDPKGKAAVLGTLLGLTGAVAENSPGPVPESVLLECRVITLLRTCPVIKQRFFEEVIRAFADSDV